MSRGLADLDLIIRSEYGHDDLGRVARDAAALWERCLKAAGVQGANLYAMINNLALPSAPANALHCLRQIANVDKHDPDPRHDEATLRAALQEAYQVASQLSTHVPGLMQQVPHKRERRFFAVDYEYFTSGESELHIFGPDISGPRFFHQEIDVFQLDGARLEDAVAAIEASGHEWRWNPPDYEEIIRQYEAESENFWRAASFVGDYRDLVTVLSRFRRQRNDLLPGLSRSDQWASVRTALALALVDGYQSGQPMPDAEHLMQIAVDHYGLIRGRGHPERAARHFASLGLTAQAAGIDSLVGPQWSSQVRWPVIASTALVNDRDWRAAITAEGLLWLSDPPSTRSDNQ